MKKLEVARHIIVVKTEAQLRAPATYNRVWIAAKNITQKRGLSRRSWVDEMGISILDFIRRGGEFRFDNGLPYKIPDLSELFPDPDVRTLSDYLESDETGFLPRTQSRRLDRVQVILIYLAIRVPSMVENILK